MRRYFFIFCFLILVSAFLPAQTAGSGIQTAGAIEQLLESEAVSYEQAAMFVLQAADLGNFLSNASPTGAFQYAVERNWLPKRVSGSDEAELQGISLLVMESFGFKGGMFYSIAKNPHYAYRELVYQEVLQGRIDPKMAVSGEYLLFVIGRALSRVEEL